MKEKPDTCTDPILEECYRMKEAFAAKFNSTQELYDYLKAEQKNLKPWIGNICHLHLHELRKIQMKKKPDTHRVLPTIPDFMLHTDVFVSH